MLTLKQLVSELAQEEAKLEPEEVRELISRYGKKVLQMGHLQSDGSLSVPTDCVLEAARSLGSRTLAEAADALNHSEAISMLRSGETFVERVGDARKRKLERMVEEFQAEPSATKAGAQWKEIEKMIFGVEYRD